MNESNTMKKLHAIREKNYEKMKTFTAKEQIAIIQSEAAPVKKRLLEKMKKRELSISGE
jgi:hypothetical protein